MTSISCLDFLFNDGWMNLMFWSLFHVDFTHFGRWLVSDLVSVAISFSLCFVSFLIGFRLYFSLKIVIFSFTKLVIACQFVNSLFSDVHGFLLFKDKVQKIFDTKELRRTMFSDNMMYSLFVNIISSFTTKQGIVHGLTCVDTLLKNGIIERKNCHLLDVSLVIHFKVSIR